MGHEAFIAIILGSHQGRDLYKKKLVRLVEQYRLNNQVKFIENCKNMPVAYKISDIVISASIEPEAFGRVSVEAQCMQKPILASNIGVAKWRLISFIMGGLLYCTLILVTPESFSNNSMTLLNALESTLIQLNDSSFSSMSFLVL